MNNPANLPKNNFIDKQRFIGLFERGSTIKHSAVMDSFPTWPLVAEFSFICRKWRHKIWKIKSYSGGLRVIGPHGKVKGRADSQSPPSPMFGVLFAEVGRHQHHHYGVDKGQRFAGSLAPLLFRLAVARVQDGLKVVGGCGLHWAFLEVWDFHLIKYKRYNRLKDLSIQF
jgi:hypothetical protein